MRIIFRLTELSPKNLQQKKIFKSLQTQTLFLDYIQRIKSFSPCEVRGAFGLKEIKSPGIPFWFCEPSARGAVTSGELASRLARTQNSGTKELHIVIGGPDGFQKEDYARGKPDFTWSFGPLTLPHELAAVVAGEQIYRAFTILHRLPYHCGH